MPAIPPPPTMTPAPISSFKPYEPLTSWRLGLSVQGLHKRGKTHFIFTAPGPIKILTNDMAGIDRVRPKEKFPGKEFTLYEIPSVTRNGHPDAVKEVAGKVWQDYKRSFIEALDTARTVVVDNLTDVWLLARLAEFGKDKGVKGMHYTGINAEFLDLLREYRTRSANLILLSKESEGRDEDGGIIAGTFKRDGFNKVENAVDDIIRCTREDPDKFSLTVLDSQNPAINGQTFKADPKTAFCDLALKIFPSTTPDMWL